MNFNYFFIFNKQMNNVCHLAVKAFTNSSKFTGEKRRMGFTFKNVKIKKVESPENSQH